MSQQWHYSRDGKSAGPISIVDLKQLAITRRLSPTDLVWKEGMPNWVPAQTIQGLFGATGGSTPPPLRPSTPPQLPASAPPRLPVATSTDPLNVLQSPVIAGLHRQRFAIVILAGVGMLATFMPWVHAPILGSISGTAGDGWITLALFIPAMVLALRGAKLQPLTGNARLGAVIPAGLAGGIGLYKIVDFHSRMAGAAEDNGIAALVQIGFGLYMLIAAGAALVVVSWFLASQPGKKLA